MRVSFLSPKASFLFKTMVPGLAGLTLTILKCGIQNFLSETQQLKSNHAPDFSPNIPQSESLWLLTSVSEALEGIVKILFHSYSNYFTFMLMMLLVNVVIHGSSMMGHFFRGEKKPSQMIFIQNSFDERSQLLRTLLKSFLIYTVFYGFYQVILIYVPLSGFTETRMSPFKIRNSEEILTSRILEEEQHQFSSLPGEIEWKKPSLSIGKALSKLDITTTSIKLSRDGKTAFVSAKYPSALKIIDISDQEDPVILSSLSIIKGSQDLISKSLIVSQDETKLFLSDIENLEIIDISNLKSPTLVAKVKDSDSIKSKDDSRIRGACKPNLLFSSDNRYLFIAGFGLQVFDISRPTTPNLISSTHSRLNQGALTTASVALSQDGKTLYYTDGSFWVYNIEDPKNLIVINSFNTTNLISSMMISKDYKTAFVVGLNQESKVLLQKLNISDISMITEEKNEAIEFDQVELSYSAPIFLEQTPGDLFLFIQVMSAHSCSWHKLITFDVENKKLLTNKNIFVKDAFSVIFTEDYKKMFIGSDNKFEIVELYLDFPNKHAFSNSSSIIQTFESNISTEISEFQVAAKNEDIIYSRMRNCQLFGVHNLSNHQQFVNVSIYNTQEDIKQMVISQDNQKAFWLSQNSIIIADISIPENITVLGKYAGEEEDTQRIVRYFILSRDGKTGYITHTYFESQYLTILDFSDPNKPIKRASVDLKDTALFLKPVLSKDERTVFIMSQNLSVYNVSDASSPVLIANLSSILGKAIQNSFPEMILSPDGNSLFLRDPFVTNFVTIRIIDVSDVFSPKMRGEFRYPMTIRYEFYQQIKISPDSKTFYVGRENSLMAVDVSNLNSPRYLGAIKILSDTQYEYIKDFYVRSDGRKALVSTNKAKLHIVSLQPMYSTYLMPDVFLLGERYNVDLQVLGMDPMMNYDRLDGGEKLIKFALVEPKSIQNSNFEDVVLKMAPPWMNVDLKSQTLTLEARRRSDIGVYRVYFGYSGQLPEDLFGARGKAEERNISADIFSSLLTSGYIDSERFLTESFGKYENFILPSQYLSIKEDIYKILKWFSFGTFNELHVVQSLNVSCVGNKLQVSTTSLTNMKVEVNLFEEGAKFLSRNYASLAPVITGDKSRLILEGSLKDVNLALKEVVIYLGNASSCDGEIIIDDKLNPIMTKPIKNISQYFNHNKPPRRNESFPLTIQNQIDQEFTYTGEHFQIKLNPNTFSDDYTLVDNLHYQLVFMKDKNETTVLPSWLSFSDMMLAGTAPEEIWNRDFDFKLIVKNEFQEFKEPLKISVRISAGFVLKLLIKYSPYILSIVGLLISANKIYNVVFKSTYRHPKDFSVKIGEEVTCEVIFPVSFIQEEKGEARKILKLLENKIGPKGKDQLLSHFMLKNGERKIDKLRVLEITKESINELVSEERTKFYLYLERGPYYLLVNQIIINTLTMYQLNSSEERETKKSYESVKKKWPEFVEWDILNSSFRINNHKEFNDIDEETTLISSDEENSSGSESLLKKSNINLDLLKDAILAYAFDCQNIDILPVLINIKVKEKIPANFLKRFLKVDLKDFPFSEKGKIGYGIGFTKKYNTLFLNGIVDQDMKHKTMVVQITTRNEKILKELWISGVAQNELGRNVVSHSEIEAQGKEYAIF